MTDLYAASLTGNRFIDPDFLLAVRTIDKLSPFSARCSKNNILVMFSFCFNYFVIPYGDLDKTTFDESDDVSKRNEDSIISPASIVLCVVFGIFLYDVV